MVLVGSMESTIAGTDLPKRCTTLSATSREKILSDLTNGFFCASLADMAVYGAAAPFPVGGLGGLTATPVMTATHDDASGCLKLPNRCKSTTLYMP